MIIIALHAMGANAMSMLVYVGVWLMTESPFVGVVAASFAGYTIGVAVGRDNRS